MPKIRDRRIITYGQSAMADVRAVNIRHDGNQMLFDIQLSSRLSAEEALLQDMQFPMLGVHNVQNCLAAVAVALEMGIDIAVIRQALGNFKGVGRRFDIKGTSAGITVVDDYGHHPVEIKAALDAGRMRCQDHKLIAVVQPHRYSRLRDLFDDFCSCFNEADIVLVADVFAAGEQPLEGFGKDDLVAGLQSYGHRMALALESEDKLAATIKAHAQSGDLVMCLGAGSITSWAAALPAELDALAKKGASG